MSIPALQFSRKQYFFFLFSFEFFFFFTSLNNTIMSTDSIFVFVVGNAGVGRMCILGQFFYNRMNLEYDGTDWFYRKVSIDGREVQFEADKDTLELMSSFKEPLNKRLFAFMLVFAIDNRDSFVALQNLYRDYIAPNKPMKVPLLLVGNKLDLEVNRCVSQEEARTLASSIGCEYMEVSAKTKVNLDEAFQTIYHAALSFLPEENDNHQSEDKKKCILM